MSKIKFYFEQYFLVKVEEEKILQEKFLVEFEKR